LSRSSGATYSCAHMVKVESYFNFCLIYLTPDIVYEASLGYLLNVVKISIIREESPLKAFWPRGESLGKSDIDFISCLILSPL